MNRMAETRRLHLSVMNAEALEYGCRASHAFGLAGGTIGDRSASWPLSDRGGRIAPLHAEIVGLDGTFCLIDRSGLTLINGASEPLGTDRIVRLADGDTVRIGPYRLNVYIGESRDASEMAADHRSLDEILAAPGPLDKGNAWVEGETGYRVLAASMPRDDETVDPLLALDATAKRVVGSDLFDATHYGLSARQESPPDRADTMVEAFRDRHFLAVPAQKAASGVHADIARMPLPPTAPSATPNTEPAPRQAVHDALCARTAALSRHDEALLYAIDEALSDTLALGVRMDGDPQKSGWNRGEAVAAFWQACASAYRRRMEQHNA